MRGAGARRQDLQYAAMDLHIKGQNVTAQIGEDAVGNEDVPEFRRIFGSYFASIRAGEAVHREDRVVSGHQLVTCIGVLQQNLAQPVSLQVALAAETAP